MEATTGVGILTEGPQREGTRFRETRKMFGRESTEELQMTRWITNELFTVFADSCGADFQSTFRVCQPGRGTLVELELSTRPRTFRARLMSPLQKPMSSGMKKYCDPI